MLVKNLNLLTKEILVEGADKDFTGFINWIFEFSRDEEDAGVLYALSATIKKIETLKEKTMNGLKSLESQTVNDLIDRYNKKTTK